MLEQLALLAAFSDIVKAVMYLVIIGSALLLIAVILLQEGKGGGFGDAFGGMGTETFGAKVGGVNKFTASIAAFFLASILGVHLINRPATPAEPEPETAQMEMPTPPPLGQDPGSPFGDPNRANGQNAPPSPGLTPQQVAERQFQLFGAAAAPNDVPQMPVMPPVEGDAPPSSATPEAPSASTDPWEDPAWGLSPEERALGSLAPVPAAVPAPDKPAPDKAATDKPAPDKTESPDKKPVTPPADATSGGK